MSGSATASPLSRPPRRAANLLTALAAFGIGCLCWLSGALRPLDRATFDLETHWLEHRIASDIVIIEVDAQSLHELGAWPWRRNRHAQLLDRVQKLGARRLFVDIDFSAPSPHPEDDAALADALARSQGSVVLPAFFQQMTAQADALILSEPPQAFQSAPSVQLGSVNLVPGADGLVRQVVDLSALSSRSIPPVWRRLEPASRNPVGDPLPLDYRISPDSFMQLSYSGVLEGRDAPDLSGKIVFLGATAIELGDIVSVPVHGALPGVIVQAIAYESAHRHALIPAPPSALVLTLLIWAAVCAEWLSRISWKRLPLASPVLILVPAGLSFLAYATLGVQFTPSPLMAVTVTCLLVALLQNLDRETLRSWRAFLQLRHQDALMRRIASVSSDGILTLNSAGAVQDANQSAATMLGLSPEALADQPMRTTAPTLFADIESLSKERPVLSRSLELSRPDGTVLPVEVVMTRLVWEDSFVISISMRDVSEQRKREEALYYHATHDSLTALGNRRWLIERLESTLANAGSTTRLALLMINLKGFKQINEIFGHRTGDDILVLLAQRFGELERRGISVARMGGDEFAVLLTEGQSASPHALYQDVRSLAGAPMVVQGVPISLETRIGVAFFPTHGTQAALLLQRADVALGDARKNHEGVAVYHSALDVSTPRRLQVASALRSAIAGEELNLHFQPKVLLSTGEVTEVEALCRWNSPALGNISPGEFMPLIEASELIHPFTKWALQCALEKCREWHHAGMALKVAVNLSARHLHDDELPAWLDQLLVTVDADPGWLELEITESAIMADADRALRNLNMFRQLGVSLSIDDFGTGYSSLAYLQKLAVNRLKIDQSFVAGLAESHHDRLIVQSTIDLAHGLGLQVIAEGIETQVQYDILRSMGCELGQGYMIARAMPDSELRSWYAGRGDRSAPMAVQTIPDFAATDQTWTECA